MADEEIRIVSSPFTLVKSTTGGTHSAGVSNTNENTIFTYQVPAGTTLAWGGAKPGNKFVFFDPETTAPAAIPGVVSVYKASPDQTTQRILLGQFHTTQFNPSAAYDKTQNPDVGLEPLRTIRTDEWILITHKADAAALYDTTKSTFRIELSKLTAVTL